MEIWFSLFKLEFLKNDQGKVGQIRMILTAYSIYMLVKFNELNEVHLWGLGVLLVAQIGEKIWKYVLQGLKIWKGKDDETELPI
jgi:hypothetical protein